MSLFSWWSCRARDFAACGRGNTLIIFTLALVPLLLAIGALIDFTRASGDRARLQNAMDAAVVAGVTAAKLSIEAGRPGTQAIEAANRAAQSYAAANFQKGSAANVSFTFTLNGVTINGNGAADYVTPNTLMNIAHLSGTKVGVESAATNATASFLDVYLVLDISASMLLPSTQDGINQMRARDPKEDCALACHTATDGSDSFGWAKKKGIKLRYQIVNEGVADLIDTIKSKGDLRNNTRLELWSFDHAMRKLVPMTTAHDTVLSKLPEPALVVDDAASATPFDKIVGGLVQAIGKGGDGTSTAQARKLVIFGTDGANDPTRSWTWKPELQPQVKAFDTAFCADLRKNNVEIAIVNTPYYPMTWDWGYNVTLGMPGKSGGKTRADDIPIVLSKCAGSLFTVAEDAASIRSAFTKLFLAATPTRLTK